MKPYHLKKFPTKQSLGKGRLRGKERGHNLELKDLGLTHM